jgi:hypothetical protein
MFISKRQTRPSITENSPLQNLVISLAAAAATPPLTISCVQNRDDEDEGTLTPPTPQIERFESPSQPPRILFPPPILIVLPPPSPPPLAMVRVPLQVGPPPPVASYTTKKIQVPRRRHSWVPGGSG